MKKIDVLFNLAFGSVFYALGRLDYLGEEITAHTVCQKVNECLKGHIEGTVDWHVASDCLSTLAHYHVVDQTGHTKDGMVTYKFNGGAR